MYFLEAASEIIIKARQEELDESERLSDRALGEDDDFLRVTSTGNGRIRIGGA